MPVDCLLISRRPGEIRIAGLDQAAPAHHKLDLFRVVRDGDQGDGTGSIYLGRVMALVPAIDAAFVDIGATSAGFLGAADVEGAGDISARTHEGAALPVQVVRAAAGEKGAKLTARIALTGTHLVFFPKGTEAHVSWRIHDAAQRDRLLGVAQGEVAMGGGWVARTAASVLDDAGLVAEAAHLRADWAALLDRAETVQAPALIDGGPGPLQTVLRDLDCVPGEVLVDDAVLAGTLREASAQTRPTLAARIQAWKGPESLFAAYGIEDETDDLLSPRVALATGGRLTITEIEALTAIDVDTGRASSGGGALEVNLDAAVEIARQIRLRDIGGLIVVDFVSMKSKADREKVLAALRGAIGADPLHPHIGGWTAAGLLEIIRRRARPSLARQLMRPGAAWVKAPLTVALEALSRVGGEDRAHPGRALRIRAHPSVIAALKKSGALNPVEGSLGRPLDLCADDRFPEDQFELGPIPAGEG